MTKVIIGSHNPVKVEVVKDAFVRVFPEVECEFEMCKAASGVADQPFGIEETRLGAANRVAACREIFPEDDYFVGLEGGIEVIGEEFWVSGWMCVENKAGKQGFGRTGAFLLPEQISQLIKKGEELSRACDIIFSDSNSGQKGGAVGFLTNNLVSRKDFYMDAMMFALVPFVKTDLYL
jgi:inosine/xanthosine triphosphatase